MDCKAVMLLSSLYPLVLALGESIPYIYRHVAGVDKKVDTPPMHIEYIDHMCGVDIADEIKGFYSCQTRCLKFMDNLKRLMQRYSEKKILDHEVFIMKLGEELMG